MFLTIYLIFQCLPNLANSGRCGPDLVGPAALWNSAVSPLPEMVEPDDYAGSLQF